jgi:dolichol-phosphate mannosyltransferase
MENFSIIVPTFHEAMNIPELVKRIGQIDFNSRLFELILVDDDSDDNIQNSVIDLQKKYSWLKLIIRKNKKKGLSESVIDGFMQAQYSLWVVMDADLSHPPEKIPEMLVALEQPHIDFVIGSRYVAGGSSDETWPFTRKILSRSAAWLGRMLIAAPVHDPLSGFIALRKKTFYAGQPKPLGWKIGLEIMVKCRCKFIQEIAIHFSQRTQGKSKLSFKTMMNYLQHVNRLLWFKFFYNHKHLRS